MAGRPRMMAKRVAQLYDAYCAIAKELDELMPKQYRQATNDSLGQTWQHATESVAAANDYLCDLASYLSFKAAKAGIDAAEFADNQHCKSAS
jgi:hypothetical protein